MAEQENYLSLQSIRMLQLFPVRKIQCLDFDLEKYKKLYDVLTCSFCRQIFNNPTYLKCSHRFCKECIEKHIRKNDKKSCPVCRGQLNTKRDSKSDLKLISLISFAFGDPVGLQNQIDKYEEEAIKNIKFVKTKSGIEMELKRDRPDSLDNKLKNLQNSSRKRTSKDNEEEQVDGKKGEQKRKNLFDKEVSKLEEIDKQKQKQQKQQASYISRSESQFPQRQPIEQNSQNQQQKKGIKINWGNTKGKQKLSNRKKKTEVIQIFSEGSNEMELSKNKINGEEMELNLNFSKNYERKNQSETRKEKKAVPNTPQRKDMNVSGPQNITQPSLQEKNLSNTSQPLKFEVVLEKNEQVFFRKNQIDQEVIAARDKLKKHLGENYLSSLITRSNKSCSTRIYLVPEPKSMTPGLRKPILQLSLQIRLSQIKNFILSKLNLRTKTELGERLVELSIVTKQNGKQILTCGALTLLDVLSTYWKDYKGINFFNINSSLASVHTQAQSIKKLNYKIKYNQLRDTKLPY